MRRGIHLSYHKAPHKSTPGSFVDIAAGGWYNWDVRAHGGAPVFSFYPLDRCYQLLAVYLEYLALGGIIADKVKPELRDELLKQRAVD